MSFEPNQTPQPCRPRNTLAALAILSCLATPAFAQETVFLPNVTIVGGNGLKTTNGSTFGDGGPALSAEFATGAAAITMDPFGNIYITDTGNNAVRRIDAASGIITTVAGGVGTICTTGIAGDPYGNGCPATQAILRAPSGIRWFKGDLYIADSSNNEVRKVSGSTGIITAYAGNGGVNLATPGLAVNASVDSPQDIAFDGAGNGYIPTGGGKPFILKVDPNGNLTIVAGTGVAGNTGDGGLATAAEIQSPIGVAIDPQGNVYFAGATPNNVRVISAATGIITPYVSTTGVAAAGFSGDGGPASLALLHTPQHIAVDALGNLYISDQANQRIRLVSSPAAGSIISTFVGTGSPANAPSGAVSVNAAINQTRGIDVTPSGDLVLIDGFNAQAKVIAPLVNLPATAVGSTFLINSGVLTAATNAPGIFAVPALNTSFSSAAATTCTTSTDIATNSVCIAQLSFRPQTAGFNGAPLHFTDALGNVFILPVGGLGNAPVATVLPGIVATLAGTGTAGNFGDNAAATGASLNAPVAVVVDALGNYFFADTANNEIREISTTGIITRIAGTGTAGFSGDNGPATSASLHGPSGLAVDGAGNLYIADTGNNRVRKVTAATGVISTFAGTGIAGYTGNGGPAASAQLNAPQGLFLTPAGLLYVADSGNHVVRYIGIRSTAIVTLAGTGKAGYTGDTAQAANATLNTPTNVAVDNSGNVYIADTGNKVIRRVSSSITLANGIVSSDIINTFAGSGLPGGAANGPAATASFQTPQGLAVDAAGDLYIADTGNNEIRLVSAGVVSTVAGIGTAGSTGNGGSSHLAAFNAPEGIALDRRGDIVIADTANNMLRTINTSSSSVVFPMTSPGSTSSQTVSLTNSGNLPLAVASVTLPPEFSEQASGGTDCNTTALSLPPASACNANIVFAPTAVQTYTGTAVITDNAQSATAATQNIALSGAGAYVFTATITGPSTATAGVSQSISVSITNPQAVYSGTIHFTSSDPKAILPADYNFTMTDRGTHVFTGVQFGTAGVQTIVVTDTVTPTVFATGLVTVVGGPPAILTVISGSGQSANINVTYTLPLVVKVTDALGNPSTPASVTFTAPSTGADAGFAGFPTFTATSNSLGLVTTPLLTSNGVTGMFDITAAVPGLTGVSFSLTNTSTVAAGFTLTSNPSAVLSLAPGTTQTTAISITPIGGFNSPVTVVCSGAPATTNCSLSTATVSPSGTGAPTNFTLTIVTTGPATSALASHHLGSEQDSIYPAVLLLCAFAARKRKRLQGLALTVFAIFALTTLSGCGNGTKSATTPQQFALTVTGTSGTITSSVVIQCYAAGIP